MAVYVLRDGRASYGNLFTCGLLWRCAVCASRLSEAQRAERSVVLMAGCRHVLVTYTLQHRIGDRLPRLLDALLGALRAFEGGSAWRDFTRCASWLGSVRSLEVTCGANGWHPHLHELAFFEGAVGLREIVGFCGLAGLLL